MGNSSSKHGGSKGPPLTRSDTSNSAKSSRSIRSRISLLKDDTLNYSSKSPKISRKNSIASLGSGKKGMDNNLYSKNDCDIPTNEKENEETQGPSLSSRSALHQNMSLNFNLPPSMIQVEPKEPILIKRGSDGLTENDAPHSHSFSILSNNSPNHAALDDAPNHSSLSRTSTNHSHHSSSNEANPLSPQSTNSGFNSHRHGSSEEGAGMHKTESRGSEYETVRRFSSSSSKGQNQVGSVIGEDILKGLAQETIDIENLIQKLLDAGYSGKKTKSVCLKNHEIQLICAKAREIFLLQPTLLELSPPVKVVGDVHGQYGDLIRIFTKCGFPPQTNYLFLGDYVDRGKQSLETILLLLCYKIKYPENFFLLRGNHECANVTRVYGFYDECKRRCNIKTWKLFIDTFNTLPIAAVVAGKIFCVHGGLSPVLNSMDEVRNIARPTDVPDFGLLNDLLWSDPADIINEWEDNERGVSYVFSKVAINKFLLKFNFDLVCRAHMVVEDGYEFFNDRTLVTVFSAPNYCGEFDNWGAVMSVSEELLCLFELLDPLDSVALKHVMKKGRLERKHAQLQRQQQENLG